MPSPPSPLSNQDLDAEMAHVFVDFNAPNSGPSPAPAPFQTPVLPSPPLLHVYQKDSLLSPSPLLQKDSLHHCCLLHQSPNLQRELHQTCPLQRELFLLFISQKKPLLLLLLCYFVPIAHVVLSIT